MSDVIYDLIVVGGGASGFSAAVSAARNNCNVLLIEKSGCLGGTATNSLVTPMMRSALTDGTILGGNLYQEFLELMKTNNDSESFFDGNPGWFSPEMMKFYLDQMAEKAGVNLLFESQFVDCSYEYNKIKSVKVINRSGLEEYKARYFIDATGDASFATSAGIKYEIGLQNVTQAMSLRFVMSGIDIEKFASWLEDYDPNDNVSPVFKTEKGDILLTTACTSEDKGWALKSLFDHAVEDGVLELCDAEYFQIFTAPGQKGSVFFNCPRIYSKSSLSPLNSSDISKAYIQGRKQIIRLAEFCKQYFPGFSDAYISNVASELGIRDSRRIKGKYILTVEDLLTARKFENSVARSNYPIDIHSKDKKISGLQFLKEGDYYDIPLECLETNEYENLMVVGKSISADFQAQASLRIQPTCWAMGESAGYIVAKRLK